MDAANVTATAGPFGTDAAPNDGIGLSTDFGLTPLDKFTASGLANFNAASGFQTRNASFGLAQDFTDGVTGTASGTANFDRDGLANFGGTFGLGLTGDNGFHAGLNANGSYDPRTGEFTGFAGVKIGGKF